MYIYIYIYIYAARLLILMCMYIYIYIYLYIMFSGPWKLSGRFRYVSVIHVSVRFPWRFHCVSVSVSVSVSISVSVTFPARFRQRSVAFPLGGCLPDGNDPKTCATYFVFFGPWAAEQIQSKTLFGKVVPTSSLHLPSRVRIPRPTFSERAR